MKCMSVPANLTFEQWLRGVTKQCLYLKVEMAKEDWWRSCYNDGLSINEAVSIYIDNLVDDDDEGEQSDSATHEQAAREREQFMDSPHKPPSESHIESGGNEK